MIPNLPFAVHQVWTAHRLISSLAFFGLMMDGGRR